MRKILFRGKPKSEADYQLFSQNWKNNCIDGFVYGSLIVSESKYYICVSTLCSVNSLINNGVTTIIEVDPETVGQYTGLTDKNGKKIFEGDILKFSDRLVYVHWHEYCGSWDCSYIKAIDGMATSHEERDPNKWRFNAKIVGNIHDNREIWVVSGDE